MLRAMTTDDIGIIIEMLLALHEESPRYGQVIPDEPYVRGCLQQMIVHPMFIGIMDIELRGFMFGSATKTWCDSNLDAYEQLLYILPEHRGGLLAPRLIKAFEKKAIDLGCWHIRAAVSTGLYIERTIAMYERLGYTREGHGVSKRIN